MTMTLHLFAVIMPVTLVLALAALVAAPTPSAPFHRGPAQSPTAGLLGLKKPTKA